MIGPAFLGDSLLGARSRDAGRWIGSRSIAVVTGHRRHDRGLGIGGTASGARNGARGISLQLASSTTTRMLSPEIPVEYSTAAAASSSVGN
jgi:hypothetical protein